MLARSLQKSLHSRRQIAHHRTLRGRLELLGKGLSPNRSYDQYRRPTSTHKLDARGRRGRDPFRGDLRAGPARLPRSFAVLACKIISCCSSGMTGRYKRLAIRASPQRDQAPEGSSPQPKSHRRRACDRAVTARQLPSETEGSRAGCAADCLYTCKSRKIADHERGFVPKMFQKRRNLFHDSLP